MLGCYLISFIFKTQCFSKSKNRRTEVDLVGEE